MSESVLVIGMGISGVAAARNALAAGHDVTIYAGPSSEKSVTAAQPLEKAGAKVIFDTEDVEGSYDLCVACPGIPQTGVFYANALAASTELVSEPEYAWRLSPEDWVAITGTNGKTTTTALTAHLLNACGITASACGNIGDTTTEAVENRGEGEVLVAEMSSYQLASTRRFRPRVAALLNITPDHLAWHGTHKAYTQAKLKMFAQMAEGDCAVLTAETPGCEVVADELIARGARVVLVGIERDADCAWCDDAGMLAYRGADGETVELVCADELQIKGPHNITNALVAASCALACGCDASKLREGLKSFTALEHRMEPCGEISGVRFYNDSKATNTDASVKALSAFEDGEVVLLAGGRDKGTDLSDLVSEADRSCACVICYGEAADRFFDAFSAAGIKTLRETGMREAFERACDVAESGQAVLLSPACASFDEFNSFGHRGEVFKELVTARLRAC